jgi:hypothetical protein
MGIQMGNPDLNKSIRPSLVIGSLVFGALITVLQFVAPFYGLPAGNMTVVLIALFVVFLFISFRPVFKSKHKFSRSQHIAGYLFLAAVGFFIYGRFELPLKSYSLFAAIGSLAAMLIISIVDSNKGSRRFKQFLARSWQKIDSSKLPISVSTVRGPVSLESAVEPYEHEGIVLFGKAIVRGQDLLLSNGSATCFIFSVALRASHTLVLRNMLLTGIMYESVRTDNPLDERYIFQTTDLVELKDLLSRMGSELSRLADMMSPLGLELNFNPSQCFIQLDMQADRDMEQIFPLILGIECKLRP